MMIMSSASKKNQCSLRTVFECVISTQRVKVPLLVKDLPLCFFTDLFIVVGALRSTGCSSSPRRDMTAIQYRFGVESNSIAFRVVVTVYRIIGGW